MSIKTKTAADFLGIATLMASFMLFVASLFFPAFNLSNGDSFGGLQTLLIGWMGLFAVGDEDYGGIGLFAWYANLFLFPIWLGLVFSKLRFATIGGLVLTIFGLGLASISIFVKTLLLDEGGSTAAVTSMGFGFYLWLSSFVICAIGYLAVLARAQRSSNQDEKNQS